MRFLILAALVLAGCSAEQMEAHRQRAAAENTRQAQDRYFATRQASTPEGRADQQCRARVQFALAGLQRTSFLDLERDARANQLHATCMEHWRRTGAMP